MDMTILQKANSPNDRIIEEHGYFRRDGKHLFYARFSPAVPATTGVVFCSPFGEEKVRTARVFVSFARVLASRGIEVLCFDYMGDGDSEGNFEDADFDDRISDTIESVNFLKSRGNIKRIGLLGLRWGATIAALASEKSLAEFLIMWEPVIDAEKYFFDYLRLNVASQMLADGAVKKNRNDLIADLESGGNVLIEGYVFTGDFFSKARQHDLRKMTNPQNCRVLLAQIHKNTSSLRPAMQNLAESFKNAETIAIGKEFEWEKTEQWMPAPPRLFKSTLEYLEKYGFLRKDI